MILHLRISVRDAHRVASGQGKNIFQSQGKVREFCEKLGKIFRWGKVRVKVWGSCDVCPQHCIVTVWARKQAGSCQTCGTHISVTSRWIFSVQSSMEFSRPVVVQHHGHLTIWQYGLAHGPKTSQIWHKSGPDFAECISPKPLDGFTPFKVLWTCLDL